MPDIAFTVLASHKDLLSGVISLVNLENVNGVVIMHRVNMLCFHYHILNVLLLQISEIWRRMSSGC